MKTDRSRGAQQRQWDTCLCVYVCVYIQYMYAFIIGVRRCTDRRPLPLRVPLLLLLSLLLLFLSLLFFFLLLLLLLWISLLLLLLLPLLLLFGQASRDGLHVIVNGFTTIHVARLSCNAISHLFIYRRCP